MHRITAIGLWALSSTCVAQSVATPTDAFAALLPAICAGAPRGELATRCGELSGADAFRRAAIGQRMEEIPGQARLANRGDGDGAPDPAPRSAAAWDFWVAYADGRVERREGRVEAGFDAGQDSLVAGATWRPASRWTLDGGWQWLRDDLAYTASDGRIRTRLDGPVLAAQWSVSDHWSIEAQASRLAGRLDLRRGIRYALGPGLDIDTEARAAPGTRRRGTALALRRHDAFGAWAVGSGLTLDRSDASIAAFREQSGAGWALAMPARRLRSERATLELHLGRAISSKAGVFVPGLRLGRVREFEDPQRTLAVTLVDDAASTPIRFLTQEPDRDWVEAAASLVWVRPGGHGGFIEWRQRLGHRFLDDRQVAIGWRIER